jgi:hypothetical protein
MVTPRNSAASADEVLRRKIEQLTAAVRKTVERKIADRGQLGFTIEFSLESENMLSDPDLGSGASAAIETLVNEYRDAGWEVKFIEGFPRSSIEFQ